MIVIGIGSGGYFFPIIASFDVCDSFFCSLTFATTEIFHGYAAILSEQIYISPRVVQFGRLASHNAMVAKVINGRCVCATSKDSMSVLFAR